MFAVINQRKYKAQVRTELPARGRSARNARELIFARCQDEADSVMLHRGSVGNTSRTEHSISPAAEVFGQIPAFQIEGKKIVHCCA